MIRGEGCYLLDDQEKRYLDFATGIGVNALGHSFKPAVEALKQQADLMWHCSNIYMHPGIPKLADSIVQDTFADTVFFCSTGSEAVETALKMTRRYHYALGRERTDFITFTGGFHGRSFAGISAGGNDVARAGYHPLLSGFAQVAFNNLEAVRAAITKKTAGILIEPIQGEGGFTQATDAFMQGLRALADEHGLLLICDEVQAGLGRSGELFSFQKSGIVPDIACIAKALGNGFPMAATLATAKAASGMTPGSHGSTYGANPLAMAVGSAVWAELISEHLCKHIAEAAALLDEKLQALQAKFPHIISGLRGRGLMRGLVIGETAPCTHYELVEKLRSNGLLTAPAAGDKVIRLLPPLIIEDAHIDEAMMKLTETLEAL